jgi:hypothetical protein
MILTINLGKSLVSIKNTEEVITQIDKFGYK